MAVKVRCGRAQLRSGTGTQDLTISGLGSSGDMAAAFFVFGWGTSTESDLANCAVGYGITDGTDSRCYFAQSRDNRGTTQQRSVGSSTDVIRIVAANTGAVRYAVSFDSWITDGVRISVDTQVGVQMYVEYWIVNGDANAKVVEFASSATIGGQVDVTTVGFQYDLAFFLSFMNGITAATAGAFNNVVDGNSYCVSIGVSYDDGNNPPPQYAYGRFDRDNVGTTEAASVVHNGAVVRHCDNTNALEQIQIANLDTDGFTAITRTVTGSINVAVLCLEFTDGSDPTATGWCGLVDSPTSTGNDTVSGDGLEVQMGGIFQSARTASSYATDGTAGTYGASMFDASNEFCRAGHTEDAVTTSNCQNRTENSAVRTYLDDGTTSHVATLSSFPTSGGFTLNYTTAAGTAQKWIAWTISAPFELERVDDTENLTETVVRLMESARVTDDTENLTESIVHLLKTLRQADDTENISEAISRSMISQRVLDDVENISEVIARLMTTARQVDETEQVSEAIVRLLLMRRVLDETEQIGETVVRQAGRAEVLDETEQVGEAIVRASGAAKVVDEVEDISETIATLLGLVRFADDTEQLSESIVTMLTIVSTATFGRVGTATNRAYVQAYTNAVRAAACTNSAVAAAWTNEAVTQARTTRPSPSRGPPDELEPAKIDIFEGEPVWTTGRASNVDGTTPALADVTAITLRVFDTADPNPDFPINTYSLTAHATLDSGTNALWRDTPANDDYWDADTVGYNFRHRLDTTDDLDRGARVYRLEYLVDTSTFGRHTFVTVVTVKSLASI